MLITQKLLGIHYKLNLQVLTKEENGLISTSFPLTCFQPCVIFYICFSET